MKNFIVTSQKDIYQPPKVSLFFSSEIEYVKEKVKEACKAHAELHTLNEPQITFSFDKKNNLWYGIFDDSEITIREVESHVLNLF